MTKPTERPVALLTAVQIMLGGAMIAVAGAWTVSVCAVLRTLSQNGFAFTFMTAVTLLCATGIALCAGIVTAEAFCLCGRVKGTTAFTARNVLALGRITGCFAGMAVLFIPVGRRLMDWFLWGLAGMGGSAWAALPAFACMVASLLVRAVQLLMKRAVEMQDEQDLTV